MPINDTQRSILIVVHVFYTQVWDELKNCIQNVSDYDLIVTLIASSKDFSKVILKDFPKAKIILCNNVGYDVWPFIKAISSVNLSSYKYLIKLHTKRSIDNYCIINHSYHFKDDWRHSLLKFVSSKRYLDICLSSLDSDESIGMIAQFNCIESSNNRSNLSHIAYCNQNAIGIVRNIANKDINFAANAKHWEKVPFKYIAGTMFIARAKLFTPPQQHLFINVKEKDFEDFSESENDLAHVYERIFGLLVLAQGYKIEDVFSSRFEIFKHRFLLYYLYKCRIAVRVFLIKHRYLSKLIRFCIRFDRARNEVAIRELRIFKIKILSIREFW